MARITVIVATLLLVTTTGFAQNQAAIDRALMAAPNRAKADAGVVSWDGKREPGRPKGKLQPDGLLRPLRQRRHPLLRRAVQRRG